MHLPLPQLRRVRWAVRGTLVLGVAASVAANVLHARPDPVAQIIAAWPPLALLLTVELISRVPVHRRSLAVVRLLATTAIAGIAAWVSYWHMAGVAARYGESGASAHLLPLSVDGLVIVASVSLVELAGRLRAAQAAAQPAATAPPPARVAVTADVPAPHQPPPPRRVPAAAPRAGSDMPAGRPAADQTPIIGPAALGPAAPEPAVEAEPETADGAAQQPIAARAAPGTTVCDPPRHPPAMQTPPDVPVGEPAPVPQPSNAAPARPGGQAGTPPAEPAAAVAYWRATDPSLTVRDICGKVGRSERTVRRILDRLPSAAQPGRAEATGGTNGSTVTALADALTSRRGGSAAAGNHGLPEPQP